MTASQSDFESMRGAANKVSDSVGAALDHASEQASSALSHAESLASDGLDRVEIAVRRNPLAAAAIAAGVGFFLAVVARR